MGLDKILVIIGAITVLTNVCTQTIKQVTWDKIPTNLLVVLIAEFLTLVSWAAYAQHSHIATTWWMWVAAVVAGVLVAYSAMFGFDKLRQALEGVMPHDGK